MIFILITMLLVLMAGCVAKSSEISEDATIVHKSYGAFTLPEMQVQKLTVNSTSVVFTTSDNEGRFLKTYEKPFNESAFRDLINLFEKNEFFEMNDSYNPDEGQPVVTDVGTLEISLTEKNREKTVKVDPYYFEYMPKGLQEIDSALLKLRTYAVSTPPEEAEEVAEAWIETAPTYSFDGSDLKLEKHEILETIPEQHLLTYTFTSRHGGYGNRTDQMVTQALTPHTIEVTVSEKNVTSAIIDGKWDEMSQEPIEKESHNINDEVDKGEVGHVNDTTNFDNTTWEDGEGNLADIKYPITGENTPWNQWYGEGNIQFIKAPTPSELIIAYYGTVYNIELSDVRVENSDLSDSSGESFYVAKVKETDFEKMEDLGWTEL